MDTRAAGVGFTAAATHNPFKGSSFTVISDWSYGVSRRYQHVLDSTTPHVLYRWLACLTVALIYVLRVYLVQGFYMVSYGLGIYILNLLIEFLSPQVDQEIRDLSSSDGPSFPTHGFDEFRPFVRCLPEFKFCAERRWIVILGTGDPDPIHGMVKPQQYSSRSQR